MAESRSDKEFLARLRVVLDEDLLDDAYPIDEVAAEVRREGGDPDAIAARGRAFAAELLDRRRLSWQTEARAKIAARSPFVQTHRNLVGMAREQLLEVIASIRSEGHLGPQVAAMFQKRGPEESTDDELRALIEELDTLRRLAETEKK